MTSAALCPAGRRGVVAARVGLIAASAFLLLVSWVHAAPAGLPSGGPSVAPAEALSPAPSGTPSGLPSPVPSSEELGPGFVRASLTSLDLVLRSAGQDQGSEPIRLLTPTLPVELEEKELLAGRPESDARWEFTVVIEAKDPSLTALFEKQVTKPKGGKLELKMSFPLGDSQNRVTLIDPRGRATELDVKARLERLGFSARSTADPSGFLVTGPIVYSRRIQRSGSAFREASSVSAAMAGVRLIYRKRVARRLTDLLPGGFKLFLDGSLVLGKTLGGDADASGLPRWLDGRMTFELYAVDRMRLEAGFGVSYFSPGLSTPRSGDLEQFLSLVLSLRFSYPITPKLLAFLGGNVALPSTVQLSSGSLTSQPMEFFVALSMPRGPNGFLEFRLRQYRVLTAGTIVSSGTYERLETFTGPEALWVWKL